ncbi:MAG: leucyl/phenylalanyl-tRNA--protein transferase [Leptospiraceae bacterium]|nr:leucyl/phenylalanyl-tRNA--protein transferase [Leptospiraceae bacterium]MCP5496628.1 leucyl/phenylalanyl-tRNA--protein transferase [Leptospiraceae bacterium]
MSTKYEDFRIFFRDPSKCRDDLVAIGGDFSPERLFYAYTHGIFPWSENPIRWYSLDPRAIFDIDSFHISKTIRKKIKKKSYTVTFNQSFKDVMRGCSFRFHEPTWITEGFIKGYYELHKKGYAHSVETWNEKGELVGGVYGVGIGKFFAGESMFAFESDAGKIALTYLFAALREANFTLFDTQQLNEVTWSLGAYEIPKFEYLARLRQAVKHSTKWTPASVDELEIL